MRDAFWPLDTGSTMFDGISSGIPHRAKPSANIFPRTNHVAMLRKSCQKRSMRGLTSPSTSVSKPSPQQISDVETKPKCTTRSNSRVQQRQDLAQYLHDRRTRSVMVRSTACCMTVKTWQRLCRTVRKSAIMPQMLGRADTWRSCRPECIQCC